MSDNKKLLKLLLSHEFYLENRHRVSDKFFPDEAEIVWKIIKEAHEKYGRTITADEVQALYLAANPAATRLTKEQVCSCIADVSEAEELGADVAKDVLSNLWRSEIGRQIAEQAIDLSSGKSASLMPIQTLLERVADDFIPQEFTAPVTTDVEELVESLSHQARWTFNLPPLQAVAQGLSPGDFAFALARSEVGKSAFAVSLAFSPGGWADQGARIVMICNEEPAARTMMRAISSYTGLTRAEIFENPKRAKLLFEPIRSRIIMLDDVDMSVEKLDVWLRHNPRDIGVIDQLDKLSVDGSFAREDERLQGLYIGTRRLAKRHDMVMFALTQASADAENVRKVTYAMCAGSKTGKAAEGDLILGIGKSIVEDGAEEDPTRYITASKNKITGWHGTFPVMLDAKLSRFEA